MHLVYLATVGGILTKLLAFVYLLVCLFLVLIVLVQRGSESGGLGGAFGGGGGETAFGVKANQALKKTTAFVATLFVFLSLLLTWIDRPVVEEEAPAGTTTNTADPADGSGMGPGPSETGGDLGSPERNEQPGETE